MTSTTSDPTPKPRRLLGLSSATWALMAAIVLGMVGAGIAVGLAVRDRDDARQEAEVVGGQAKQLVECVKGPDTNCQSEAAQVEESIGEVVPGAPGADGSAGPAGTDGSDGADGATGPRGQRGPRGFEGDVGPQGPRGFIGPIGPAGIPGENGTSGADGAPGPAGPQGPAGERGPAGADGAPGRDGTATPGTYSCADGQFINAFTIAPDGGVTLDCRDGGLFTPQEPR